MTYKATAVSGEGISAGESPVTSGDREIAGSFALDNGLDLPTILRRFLDVGPMGVQIWHCPNDDPGEAVPVYTNEAGYADGAPRPGPGRRTMRELLPSAMAPLPGRSDGLADLVWRAAVLDEPGHVPRIGAQAEGARILDIRVIPLGSRCCAITARDVSAEVNAVRQLRQSVQELVDSLDDGHHRNQAVVHDLKTPLTAIIGYADLMVELAKRGDQRIESVADRLVETSHRTLRMVEDLLSRNEHDHLVDLDDVVRDVLDVIRPALEEAGGTLQVGALPRVTGSLTGYRHLVQNLLTNSIRYRHPERPLQVHVSAREVNGMWRLRFIDNGVGITQDRREQVFLPGIRLEPSPGDHGSGLGLSLCRTIVERFGGTIRIGDTPPELGTTIIVELPVTPDLARR